MITHSQSPVEGKPQTEITLGGRQSESWLEVVNAQVASLQFGSVIVSIHEGRVVQVETTTKLRFDKDTTRT